MRRFIKLSILIFFIIINLEAYLLSENKIYITQLDNPAPGYIFIAPFIDTMICLIDNSGNPVYGLSRDGSIGIADLKVHPNGIITYYDFLASKFYGMNSKFEIVDSFQCANGVHTDFHDIQLLSNGHVLLIGEIDSIINMKRYVPNGNERARVIGFVIQELDEKKNLVFQWNTFDHFKITDATEDVDLTGNTILYVHCNAIELDNDGNLLLCSRHLDEITKIDRSNGNIIWRWGGSKCKNNQFTFLNDTIDGFYGFSHQHDARRLPNGNILMLDNGNLKNPPFSRAVEYRIDESAKTAYKVWEYRKDPDVFVPWLGNAQRLPNGNTMIGWGAATNLGEENMIDSLLIATEVRPNGEIAFEMLMDFVQTYRIFRFPIKMFYDTKNISTPGSYSFNTNSNTYITLDLTTVNGNGSLTVEKHEYEPFNKSYQSDPPCSVLPYRWVINKNGINSIGGTIKINLSFIKKDFYPIHYSIYQRSKEATGQFKKLTTVYDEPNNILYANFTGFGEFLIGCDILVAPNMFNPPKATGSIQRTTEISWDPQLGAEKYRFQLSTNSDMKSLIIDTLMNNNKIKFNNLAYFTTYYWRVQTKNDLCQSEWSDISNFITILRSTNLSLPPNNGLNAAVDGQLLWTSVNGANSYRVQVALDSSFKNIVIDKITLNPEYSYSELQYNTQYFWRVKAINPQTQSNWSEVWSFWTVLPSPKLLSPPNAEKGKPIEGIMSWEKVSGALYYNIQISTDEFFSYDTFLQDGITNLSFAYKNLKNDTVYYWRVRAVNNTVYSHWSDVWSFRTVIPPPILEYPENEALDIPTNGIFKWKNVNNADNYILQVAEDTSFAKLIYENTHIQTTVQSFPILEKNKTYFWRMKSQNNDGISQWSEFWSFITQPEFFLEVPKLAYPENNAINIRTSGTLHWENAQGAESYWVQISNSPLFKYNLSNDKNVASNSFIFNGLNHNTKYYWRVASQSKYGISNWSEIWEFTTNLASPVLKYPSNNQTNVPIDVTLEWNPSYGAISYHFQISDDSHFDNIIDDAMIENATEFKAKGLAPETFYWWHVKALNGEKESDWSEDWFFTTNEQTYVDENGDNRLRFAIVFPNPFNDKIIVATSNLSSEISFRIYDIIGNELISQNINSINTSNLIELDATNLPAGVYHYSILSGKYYKCGKIIKLK